MTVDPVDLSFTHLFLLVIEICLYFLIVESMVIFCNFFSASDFIYIIRKGSYSSISEVFISGLDQNMVQ